VGLATRGVGLVVLAVIAMSLRDVNRYRRIRRM